MLRRLYSVSPVGWAMATFLATSSPSWTNLCSSLSSHWALQHEHYHWITGCNNSISSLMFTCTRDSLSIHGIFFCGTNVNRDTGLVLMSMVTPLVLALALALPWKIKELQNWLCCCCPYLYCMFVVMWRHFRLYLFLTHAEINDQNNSD